MMFSRESILIATVLKNLLSKHAVGDTKEEALVIEALRRSSNALADASHTDLGNYLSSMDASELRGVANNIKGIYHELYFVEKFNSSQSELTASCQPSTTAAGSDILIRDKHGAVVDEVQLKATDSTSYLNEHIERYPNIKLLATDEIAEKCGISSSDISNAEITSDVASQIDALSDISTVAQSADSVATSGFLSAALRAAQVVRGEIEVGNAGKEALKDIGVAVSTTALVSLLFG